MKRTFKILISLISLVAVLSLLVVPALADGPDDDAKKEEPGMTGGAAYDPDRVLTLTPKQQREWKQKLAEAQRLLEIIQEAEKAGDDSVSGGSPNVGSTYMGLWK